MNQTAYKAITTMLNAFPQSPATNKELLLLSLEKVVGNLSDQAVANAAGRFMAGDVQGQSMTFPPSVPEFVQQVRKCQELVDVAARPRLPSPKYQPGPLAPFQVAQQNKLAENSHLPVLFDDINFEQWKRMSAEKQVPVGSKWVAMLGIVYGPEKPKKETRQ